MLGADTPHRANGVGAASPRRPAKRWFEIYMWRQPLRFITHLMRIGILSLCTLPLMASIIPGGNTIITLTEDFASLGIFVTPIGSASLSGSTLSFPITGGMIDETTLVGVYEHEGSGAKLSDGFNHLQFLNLVVNTITGRVYAAVQVNGVSEGAPSVFVIGDDRSLTLSVPLAALAAAAFGLQSSALNGTVAGTAIIDAGPQADSSVPEPSTVLMFGAGTLMLWVGRRRLAQPQS